MLLPGLGLELPDREVRAKACWNPRHHYPPKYPPTDVRLYWFGIGGASRVVTPNMLIWRMKKAAGPTMAD